MKAAIRVMILILLLPVYLAAQDTDDWPSLAYLKSDYKAVNSVALIRINDAEITSRIPGYENWRVRCEVLESFKGRFRKGDLMEYFLGAEAGFTKKAFTGEKIVFLLAEFDKSKGEWHYSVLENSTLPSTPERLRKLRLIMRNGRRGTGKAVRGKSKAVRAKS